MQILRFTLLCSCYEKQKIVTFLIVFCNIKMQILIYERYKQQFTTIIELVTFLCHIKKIKMHFEMQF
jgi:hypothetical protein